MLIRFVSTLLGIIVNRLNSRGRHGPSKKEGTKEERKSSSLERVLVRPLTSRYDPISLLVYHDLLAGMGRWWDSAQALILATVLPMATLRLHSLRPRGRHFCVVSIRRIMFR